MRSPTSSVVGMGTDYSFSDGGKLRSGIPLITMDAALVSDEPIDEPTPKPTRKTKPMTAEQLLEGVAAMVKKGMSNDDIVDGLLKMRGGSDDPKAEGAMDRARKASVAAARHKEMFPNANRLAR